MLIEGKHPVQEKHVVEIGGCQLGFVTVTSHWITFKDMTVTHGGKSITNAADDIVRYVGRGWGDDIRIGYFDSENEWWELKSERGSHYCCGFERMERPGMVLNTPINQREIV